MTARRRSLRVRARASGERGETLVELLVTIGLMGVLVVGIVFAMGAAVTASDVDRKNGRLETLLRNGAEAISAADYDSSGAYVSALGAVPHTGDDTVESALNAYLDPSAGATPVVTATDLGLQELTLTARSGDSDANRQISKTLVIIKRTPAIGAP